MISFRSQGKSVELHQPILVADGVTARFYEAGHMLGSTSIELTVQENGSRKVIVFSGDLGPYEQPIVRPFEQLPYADLVFLESTYGNRNHRPYTETMNEFEQILLKAVEQKGKILIPAFAIGRTQQILYHLAILFLQKKVTPFPIFVDSPMAIEAGKVFLNHPDLFDEEATEWKNRGLLPFGSYLVQIHDFCGRIQAAQRFQWPLRYSGWSRNVQWRTYPTPSKIRPATSDNTSAHRGIPGLWIAGSATCRWS